MRSLSAPEILLLFFSVPAPRRRPSLARRFGRHVFVLGASVVVGFLGVVVVLAQAYRWVNPPVSTLMVLRALQGVAVHAPQPLAYAKIPLSVKRNIIYLEDHSFWTHHGVVWGAIREAWEANVEAGRLERGGSTITQQLARTLFLFPERMFLRKGLEAAAAFVLEATLSKERILELYLNNIEWGPGRFGIEAGARYNYGTSLRNLNADQQARLLAIVTNPVAFTVKTLHRNAGMAARYRALLSR